MACIGCGLGVNADGKGRVDVDTKGGLTCSGNAGGTTNAAGRGLAIKKDTVKAGNSVELSTNGLYVPRAFNFEVYSNYFTGGAVSNPDYPANDSKISGVAAITFDNSKGSHRKDYTFTTEIRLASGDLTPGWWVELQLKYGDDAWITPHAFILPTGSLINPLRSATFAVAVDPGKTYKVSTRFRLYRGTISSYVVGITGWGGYSKT